MHMKRMGHADRDDFPDLQRAKLGLDVNAGYMNVVGPIVLLVKMVVLVGIIFFVRFTYPRLREDQLQKFAWTVLIPISLLNITATAILKVVF